MYIHNFQHGLMNKFGRYSRVQCVCGSSDELPSFPSFSYKKFSIIWDIYGSRIVPGKKNILSSGRHLLSGGRHLIIWRPPLIIWRPPLNYRFLNETKFGLYFSKTAVLWPKYCRYGVKHYVIFSMMELNTAAALYFHMGFSYKENLCSLAVNH